MIEVNTLSGQGGQRSLGSPASPVAAEQQPVSSLGAEPEFIAAAYMNRALVLRELLDPTADGLPANASPNYEYARDSGLIDLFYYDPVSGDDGLLHTLQGEVVTFDNGAVTAAGYHHESSSRKLGTFVDRESVEELPSNKRRNFRDDPYGPYNAVVYVEGYRKALVQRHPKTGQVLRVHSGSTMFPREYDALAVMQAARLGLEGANLEHGKEKAERFIVVDGEAPSLHPDKPIPLRYFLHKPAYQMGEVVICSVFPHYRKSQRLNLSRAAINTYLGLTE